MKKKILIIAIFFIAMFLVMLFMPNKAMAVTQITRIDQNNSVPTYGHKVSESIDLTAYAGESECSTAVNLYASRWEYEDSDGIKTFNASNPKSVQYEYYWKLITTVRINASGYEFSNSLTATSKNTSGSTGGTVEVNRVSSTEVVLTSTYYRCNTEYTGSLSDIPPLVFTQKENDGASFYLVGSNVTITATASDKLLYDHTISGDMTNYKPYNVQIFDMFNTSSETSINANQISEADYYNWSFTMPAYCARVSYSCQKVLNAQVMWRDFDFVEYGTGKYKFASNNISIIRGTDSDWNFDFNKDTKTLIIKNVSTTLEGEKYTIDGKDTLCYLYVNASSDSTFTNFTLKTIGEFKINAPADRIYPIMAIYVTGAHLTIENDSGNTAKYNFILPNSYNWDNYGIYCTNHISIINHDYSSNNNEIRINLGYSKNYSIGIHGEGDVSIEKSNVSIQFTTTFNSGNISNNGIIRYRI